MSTSTTQPEQPIPVTPKRRPVWLWGAIAGALLVGLVVYVVQNFHQEYTDDAQVEADVIPLAVRTGGLVLKVLVKENQMVKAGDAILQLDEADQAARVRQAEAQLAIANAQLAMAVAQVSVVEAGAKGGLQTARAGLSSSSLTVANANAQMAAAKAGVERARADTHKAQLDYERAKTLRAANAITQERLDNAQTELDMANAAFEQATAQLTAAEQAKAVAQSRVVEAEGRLGQSTPIEAQIAAARANVDLAHAQVQAAQAGLALQQLQFAYLRLIAPVDGQVSRLSAHNGQLLQVGQAVAEMVPSETYVIANFKETQIGRMRPGQPVRIHIDAYGDLALKGKIESLSGGTGARFALLPPDNASGNFVKVVQRLPVRIVWTEVPNDLFLRAGLSADVTVDVSRD